MSYKRVGILRRSDLREINKPLEDAFKYAEYHHALKEPVSSEWLLRRLVLWRLYGEQAETAYAFLFDKKHICVSVVPLCKNGVRLWDFYRDAIVPSVSGRKIVSFALAHSHMGMPLVPSPDDLRLTAEMKELGEKMFPKQEGFRGHFITDNFNVVKIPM